MVEIDNIDKKILSYLQTDCTLSLEHIGEKIGLSRNACWKRIKLLDKKGYIKSRIALLDAKKMNVGLTVFIQVKTNQHDDGWLDKFSQITKSMPEILGVYRMSGDLDYLLRAQVPNMDAYDKLYKRLIKQINLTDVSASFVMEEIKETTALPL